MVVAEKGHPKSKWDRPEEVIYEIEGAEATFKIFLATSSGTILRLKYLIEIQVGIPIIRQTLRFKDEILDDNSSVINIGFLPDGTVYKLHLQIQPLPEDATIVIGVYGMTPLDLRLTVKETDTALMLKEKIGEVLSTTIGRRLPPESMDLWFMNWKMNDSKRLCDYYIHEGSRVCCEMVRETQ